MVRRNHYNLVVIVSIIGLHLVSNVDVVSSDESSTTTAKPKATSDNESKQPGKLPIVSTKAPNDLGVAKNDTSKSVEGKSRASDDELVSDVTTEKPSSDEGDSRASDDELVSDETTEKPSSDEGDSRASNHVLDSDKGSMAIGPKQSGVDDVKNLLDKGKLALEHIDALYKIWLEFLKMSGMDGGGSNPPPGGMPPPGDGGGSNPPPGGMPPPGGGGGSNPPPGGLPPPGGGGGSNPPLSGSSPLDWGGSNFFPDELPPPESYRPGRRQSDDRPSRRRRRRRRRGPRHWHGRRSNNP